MSRLATMFALLIVMMAVPAGGQEPSEASARKPATQATTRPTDASVDEAVGELLSEPGSARTLKWVGLITVLSVAPALAVMVTSFTRIVVVLGLLRQALAMPNLPPNQVLFALAVLMTVVVMGPVLQAVWGESIEPWRAGRLGPAQAGRIGLGHLRGFMIRQLQAGGNGGTVNVFLPAGRADDADLTWADVPTASLIPAFVLGELKLAFLMGLRFFLPFVIIDMLVGSVLVSMGMLMLPPVLVAMPLKLLMFVMADGWTLVAGTVMNSFV
jgi:flagellar biosynthesis protein FliP